jgi:hypothetical protein
MVSRKSAKNKASDPTVNGRGRKVKVPQTGSDRDASLLRDAVENPGVKEIPPAAPRPAAAQVLEIPERPPAPGQENAGEPVAKDPALMTVEIDRPGPHSWVQVFPELALRTPLLPYRSGKSGIPDHHYVDPALEGMLRRHLKPVRVQMVFDVGGGGEAFLWVVPESEWSPYFAALQLVLSKGKAFLDQNLFLFGRSEGRKRGCQVQVRARTPDDPVALLPSRPISQLLPEALGPERWITTTSHPVYVALTAGRALL